jgi:uncharacterized membrane protein
MFITASSPTLIGAVQNRKDYKTLNKYVKAYIACAAVMVAIDAVWLGVIALDFYQRTIGHLLAGQPDFRAAALFYALYIAGIVIFAVRPALDGDTWKRAALLGALYGLFCYMTYDLTNVATLRDFPWIVAAVDIAWGMFISAVTATAGFLAAARVGRPSPDA